MSRARAAQDRVALVGPETVPSAHAHATLGGYPELRTPGTSERFIVGTFTSVLWAAACAGIGWLSVS